MTLSSTNVFPNKKHHLLSSQLPNLIPEIMVSKETMATVKSKWRLSFKEEM